ncbi:MAG: hypothetical protein ACXWT1_01310 [Methylobacter sp.]
MPTKKIELLRKALLHDGKMEEALYEFELKRFLKEWESSMAKDKDDFIFAITENKGDIAMVLIEKAGQVHINEDARERLKALWPAAYESNMKKLIPTYAKELSKGEITPTGVKIVERV